MKPRTSAVAAACALCAALTMASEGLVTRARPDPVGIPTVCYGHTGGVKLGDVRSPQACEQLLQRDLLEHGSAIDACIHREIPLKTRAAFTDFAFNVGPGAFCRSSMAQRVDAGDLAAACAGLSAWIYAGGKPLPGLVRRRAAERALCEAGLQGR